MDNIYIKEEYIKLNQLLKYIGLIGTGGEVKHFIENNNVVYNGAVVFELRKKIYANTAITINGEGYFIVRDNNGS